jgi:magnesium-transporting ATPase (P-type)
MGNEIQKSLAQRTKELLQTDEEHSLFELAELLRQFRNETHPDKFQDQELKTKAEARFKDAQSLLDELEKQLEIDRFNRRPNELAVYKPLYDVAQLQSESDKLKTELSEAKSELAAERDTNATLNKQLAEKNDNSLRAEIQQLKDIYRPSTRKFASIGMAIVLPAVLAVMTQMEHVSDVIQKYSPLPKQYVTTALFVCMLLALVTAVRKVWEQSYIKRRSEEVCSSKSAEEFLRYLK